MPDTTPRTPGLEERLREIEDEIEAAEVNGYHDDRIDYLAEEARELLAYARALTAERDALQREVERLRERVEESELGYRGFP